MPESIWNQNDAWEIAGIVSEPNRFWLVMAILQGRGQS